MLSPAQAGYGLQAIHVDLGDNRDQEPNIRDARTAKPGTVQTEQWFKINDLLGVRRENPQHLACVERFRFG